MSQTHDAVGERATGLFLGHSPGRGRGVFAGRALRAGELVERAPVIVVPRPEVACLRGTTLDDYFFWWDADHNAMALGWASLYNHACPANAEFSLDRGARCLVIAARIDIAAGEEITINYHGDALDASPVWFAQS